MLFVMAMVPTTIYAQCGVHKKRNLKSCEGIYLKDQVIESNSEARKKIALVLTKNVKYAFYMLNPSKTYPDLEISRISKMDSIPVKVVLNFNKDKNFKVFVFTPEVSSSYLIKFDFGTEKDACVLFALYFQGKVE
jgi:hypothetical protein